MREATRDRLRWMIGLLIPWVALWAVLGALSIWDLRAHPHPFLPDEKLAGNILRAVIEWALAALAAHLLLALVAGCLVLLVVVPWKKDAPPMQGLGLPAGLLAGTGTLLLFHGIAYLQVPLALDRLPGVNQLPIGLSLFLLFAGGSWMILRAVQRHQSDHTWLRAAAAMLLLVGLQQLPHDLFRRWAPNRETLAAETPRLLILSFDGMNRSAFDQGLPEWGMPPGTLAVAASPGTRTAWELLLGADPSMVRRATLVPYYSELKHPERLGLVTLARDLGLRTAFQIDDASTPTFSLSPTHFSTVREPFGGWKYFLTLVGSTTWPAHAYAQNLYSPVETSNPWCSLDAFWRDADRLLTRHHWVSAHQCGLHWPIILNFEELRDFQGWRWLAHRPRSYRALQGSRDLDRSGQPPSRLADALDHYLARSRRLLRSVQPWIREWERDYPSLSGVLTADHGELHLPIEDKTGKPVGHFEGTHGFGLQPETLSIPIHPFGNAKIDWGPQGPLSWFELRDGILGWLRAPANGLHLASRQGGLLIEFPAVRGMHLDTKHAQGVLPGAGASPTDVRDKVVLTREGLWFVMDPAADPINTVIMAYALVERGRITTFNPMAEGYYQPMVHGPAGVQTFQAIPREPFLVQINTLRPLLPKAVGWGPNGAPGVRPLPSFPQ